MRGSRMGMGCKADFAVNSWLLARNSTRQPAPVRLMARRNGLGQGFLKRFCPTAAGRQGLQPKSAPPAMIWSQKASQPGTPIKNQEDFMNTIIYIVGLVVIIGFILSYFGFR